MGICSQYEDEKNRSWGNGYEQVNYTIYKERKVNGMKSSPRIHTQESHDYHMDKWKRCVYCDNGYRIGTIAEVQEALGRL